MSDRSIKISFIDKRIKHLQRQIIVDILHILHSAIDHKHLLEKDDGIHVRYDNIQDNLLDRIYQIVKINSEDDSNK